MAAARRAAPPVAVLVAVCAAFGYVGAVDPNEPGHYPVRPLLHHTGILCPGCGGLRSAHALAHGDPVAAAGANALVVAAVLALGCLWAAWTARCLRSRQGAPRREPAPGARRSARDPAAAPATLDTRHGRTRTFDTGMTPHTAEEIRAWARVRARWYRPAWAAAGLLVVAFTVARNLPAGGWLAP